MAGVDARSCEWVFLLHHPDSYDDVLCTDDCIPWSFCYSCFDWFPFASTGESHDLYICPVNTMTFNSLLASDQLLQHHHNNNHGPQLFDINTIKWIFSPSSEPVLFLFSPSCDIYCTACTFLRLIKPSVSVVLQLVLTLFARLLFWQLGQGRKKCKRCVLTRVLMAIIDHNTWWQAEGRKLLAPPAARTRLTSNSAATSRAVLHFLFVLFLFWFVVLHHLLLQELFRPLPLSPLIQQIDGYRQRVN